MSHALPLSDAAKAAGHQLYQALYAPTSEGLKLTLAQAQLEIDRLASPEVSVEQLIRAAMAEADYRYREACDDDSAQTIDDYVPEPTGRMLANMDVVNLLQEAQIERQEAEAAQLDLQLARWEAEDALRDVS